LFVFVVLRAQKNLIKFPNFFSTNFFSAFK
jgi:hypothetical protein